jgi:hypothetical protein
MKIATIALAAALLPAWAQEIKMPVNLDALADKADDAVTVTLDKSMLQLAGKFIGDGDDDAWIASTSGASNSGTKANTAWPMWMPCATSSKAPLGGAWWA